MFALFGWAKSGDVIVHGEAWEGLDKVLAPWGPWYFNVALYMPLLKSLEVKVTAMGWDRSAVTEPTGPGRNGKIEIRTEQDRRRTFHSVTL